MHKRFVNHCTINLTLIPDGPILIKSGKEGADPTKPNMEFVEIYYAQWQIAHAIAATTVEELQQLI